MPSQLTYPGVYIEEIPSGVRPITAVATSNGAFVGFFAKGPSDRAVEINGMADFNRIFGGVSRRSEAGYAISQFFLNGGSKAYVVRVVIREKITTGGVTYEAAAAARSVAKDGTAANADEVMNLTSASDGVGGNTLRATVEPIPFDEQRFTLRLGGTGHTPEEHLNLSVNPTSGSYFVRYLAENSELVVAEHDAYSAATNPASYTRPAATGTLGAWFDAPASFDTFVTGLKGKTASIAVRITNSNGFDDVSGAHTATVDWATAADKPANMRRFRKLLEDAIRKASPATGDTHPSIAGISVALYEGKKADGTTRYRFHLQTDSGWSHLDGSSYSPHEYINVTGSADLSNPIGLGNGAANNVQEYTFGSGETFDRRAQVGSATAAQKGEEGYTPDPTVPAESDAASAIATALLGDPATKKGIYALEDADIFNILCMPITAKLPDNEMTTVVSTALSYCEEKRAFMIVDIPPNVDRIQEMKDWIDEFAGFRSSYAAAYFPRLLIPDPKDKFKKRSFGVSGTVAGVYARTDVARGVWKAPAGLDAGLEGVSQLDYQMTDAENGSLNPIGVNCIRVFPIHGQVVWGARTLDGADVQASEWKYIPIRRLALMIEESLYRGTRWVVFQPNDEPTWAKVRQNVGAFMFNLFRQGAFQGSTPKKAFYVKCDGETTTAIDRNLGIVNIEVGFAPLKPAEFVVIKIQQIPDIV